MLSGERLLPAGSSREKETSQLRNGRIKNYNTFVQSCPDPNEVDAKEGEKEFVPILYEM